MVEFGVQRQAAASLLVYNHMIKSLLSSFFYSHLCSNSLLRCGPRWWNWARRAEEYQEFSFTFWCSPSPLFSIFLESAKCHYLEASCLSMDYFLRSELLLFQPSLSRSGISCGYSLFIDRKGIFHFWAFTFLQVQLLTSTGIDGDLFFTFLLLSI